VGACTGITSDIQFTLLVFTSETGEAIMCALILKSKKHVSEIPISWKLRIDITKEVQTGATLLEIYNNSLQSGVLIGGPKCTYQQKTIPYFVF
jgi:hypothetical protein